MTKDDHKGTYVEGAGLIDQIKCACGWESKSYYDGLEFAQAEHTRHVDTLFPVGHKETCKLPPAGWTCSRVSGHTGPCAAYPPDKVVR